MLFECSNLLLLRTLIICDLTFDYVRFCGASCCLEFKFLLFTSMFAVFKNSFTLYISLKFKVHVS